MRASQKLLNAVLTARGLHSEPLSTSSSASGVASCSITDGAISIHPGFRALNFGRWLRIALLSTLSDTAVVSG